MTPNAVTQRAPSGRFALCGLGLLLAGGCAAGPAGSPRPNADAVADAARQDPTPATLQFDSRSVADVLRWIGAEGGRDVRVDDDVTGSLWCGLQREPWDLALDAVVRAAGLSAVWRGDHVFVAKGSLEGEPFRPESTPSAPRGRGHCVELRPSARIDVQADDLDLNDVAAQLERASGHPFRVHPTVRETVRIRLKDIPWREAAEVIARMARCELREDPEDGALVFMRPVCLVTLTFQQADVRLILVLCAAYTELSLVIAPDVGRVPVDIDSGATVSGLAEIVRIAGLHAERRGSLVVVTRRPLGWGEPFKVDGLELPPPGPPGDGGSR